MKTPKMIIPAMIVMRSLNQQYSRQLLKLLMVWLALGSIALQAQQQQQGFCARVKIVILQELTLERIGFEATLEVTNNDGEDPITDFFADLTFENPSLSTNAVNDSSSLFFVRAPQMENISDVTGTGIIGPTKKAVVRWFIIPKIKAGGSSPDGVYYKVGAKLSAKFRGVDLPADMLTVYPDSIRVKPEPQLDITYFQPRDVQGDDPFTPEVESPTPFTLGVLVKNSGYGVARSLKINSQQPKIVENKRNLLLIAQLLGARVMDSPLNQASLLVDLGDILPAQTKKGAWDMITSLSGEFTEFKASYTHSSDLGGEETSVIKSLEAHFIAHEVLNDQPGRDKILDFLADTDRDENMIPDALYESEGQILPVNYLAQAVMETSPGAGGVFKVNLNSDRTGWGYMRLNDPGQNRLRIASIVRSDGKILNTNNFWTNTRYAKITNARSDYLNIMDLVDLGTYSYTITYAAPLVDTTPPVTTLHFVGDSAQSGGKYYISPDTQMYFLSEDQSPVSIYYSVTNGPFLPAYPFKLQTPGEYDIRFYAEDKSMNREATNTVSVVVGNTGPSPALFSVSSQPIIVAGDALSVRPGSALVTFRGRPSPTAIDAYIDVFQGVVAWPTVAGVPSSPTRSNSASLIISGSLVDYYSYRIDNQSWSADQPVGQPLTLTNLSAGSHSVSVLGRSQYGGYMAASNAVTVSWLVDPSAPVTVVTGTPATPALDLGANLLVGGSNVTSYRWTINNGYYRAATGPSTPLVLSNLSAGTQTVAVITRAPVVWQATNNPTIVQWVIDPLYGYDQAGLKLVKSVVFTNIGQSFKSYSWNGRDEKDVIVLPGYYTIRLTLKDQVGRVGFATRITQVGDFAGGLDMVADVNRGPQRPHARGRWAVWQDQSTGNWQVYAMDVADKNATPMRISNSQLSQENAKTDGRIIVWQSRQVNGNWDVWYYDLLSPAGPKALTSTSDMDETNPAVEWPWIVYESKPTLNASAPKQLRAQNLLTREVLSVSDSTQDELNPEIQGGRVVWQDFRDVGSGEIYFKNLETGESRRLTTNIYGQYHPVIYDQWVVWQDNRNGEVDLYGYDLLRNTEVRITQTTENETRPRLEGPWCVCEEDSLGITNINLRLIHLPSLMSMPLTRTTSVKSRPSLVSTKVVWQDTANGQDTIKSATVPAMQAVYPMQNVVAVTETMASNYKNAYALLLQWNKQAGVQELTRFAALSPSLTPETAGMVNGQISGVNFNLSAGSFLWVKFGTNQVIDLGLNTYSTVDLVPGLNVLTYTAFPGTYSAFKLIRQLGLDKVRAIRMLDSQTGRWRTAEVVDNRLVGQDFSIPMVSVVLLDMVTSVNQWRPEP